MISMTGAPLVICEKILAPPRSIPVGSVFEVVRLIPVGEVTVKEAPERSPTVRASRHVNATAKRAAAHSASLFQTGWFVESLLTQTLIIHVIRTNKIPFVQSRPSAFLMAMSVMIMAIGVALPFTPLGRYLGFTELPPLYWAYLAVTLLCYVLLTQAVKAWLLRHEWI